MSVFANFKSELNELKSMRNITPKEAFLIQNPQAEQQRNELQSQANQERKGLTKLMRKASRAKNLAGIEEVKAARKQLDEIMHATKWPWSRHAAIPEVPVYDRDPSIGGDFRKAMEDLSGFDFNQPSPQKIEAARRFKAKHRQILDTSSFETRRQELKDETKKLDKMPHDILRHRKKEDLASKRAFMREIEAANNYLSTLNIQDDEEEKELEPLADETEEDKPQKYYDEKIKKEIAKPLDTYFVNKEFHQLVEELRPLIPQISKMNPRRRTLAYLDNRSAFDKMFIHIASVDKVRKVIANALRRFKRSPNPTEESRYKDAWEDIRDAERAFGLLRSVRSQILDQEINNIPQDAIIQTYADGALTKVAIQLVLGDPERVDAPDTPEDIVNEAIAMIEKLQENRGSFGYYGTLTFRMIKKVGGEVVAETDIDTEFLRGDSYSGPVSHINHILEKVKAEGSAWTFRGFVKYTLTIFKKTIGRFGAYRRIPVPEKISNKKATIDVESKKDDCLKWALIAAINSKDPKAPKENKTRQSKWRQFEDKYSWDGMDFPSTLQDVTKFEDNNGIPINVYGISDQKIIPVQKTKNMPKDPNSVVNLLILVDTRAKKIQETMGHFVAITNISRLLGSQISKCNGRKFICPNCDHNFKTDESLQNHYINCLSINTEQRRYTTPTKEFCNFDKYSHTQRVPILGFLDIETRFGADRQHIPMKCAFILVCSYTRNVLYKKVWTGDGCEREMLYDIPNAVDKYYPMHRYTVIGCDTPFVQGETTCFFCEKIINNPFRNEYFGSGDTEDDPVKHHDHFTPNRNANFLGWSHRSCNRNAGIRNLEIPIIAHNGDGYDFPLMFKHLKASLLSNESPSGVSDDFAGKPEKFNKIDGMHTTNDGVRNLSFRNLRFQDSMHFVSSSLDNWNKDTWNKRPTSDMKVLCQLTDKPDLFREKGVFPYEHMTTLANLEEEQLPCKEAFFSRLNNSNISDDEYARAQQVWIESECKTMDDYTEKYLLSDIGLLADCYLEFVESNMNNFGIDPSNTLGTPGLTWMNMLKFTGVKIDLETDPDMIMMTEKGFRGGITSGYRHKVVADEKTHIGYYDANGLYGSSTMGTSKMPQGDYQWEEAADWSEQRILDLDPMGDRGYQFEVDLVIPDELHDKFQAYPPISESCGIPDEWLGKHELDRITLNGGKHDPEAKTLIQTLLPKKNYVVFASLLQKWVQMGVKVTKIHKVKSFHQSLFLKKYSDHCTIQRQAAAARGDKVSANLFKLMLNSLYGRTCMNPKNYRDTKFSDARGLEKHFNDFRFRTVTVLNDELFVVGYKKIENKYNTPTIIGACILDCSKLIMLRFWYDVIQPRWPEAYVAYTDTDSLLTVTDSSVLARAAHDKDLRSQLDLSNLKPLIREQLFAHLTDEELKVNAKAAGTFSNDTGGVPIQELTVLRAKAYSMRLENGDSEVRAKGVKKSVAPGADVYDDVVSGKTPIVSVAFDQFVSVKGEEGFTKVTKTMEKKALSMLNIKRYSLTSDPSGPTLPYGHYKIR